MPPTLAESLDAALDAYADLTELAEEIDDEWSYVQDLTAAWRARIGEAHAASGEGSVDAAVVAALEMAAAEIRLVEDPHRAIDWLSTFPQLVLLALGVEP